MSVKIEMAGTLACRLGVAGSESNWAVCTFQELKWKRTSFAEQAYALESELNMKYAPNCGMILHCTM